MFLTTKGLLLTLPSITFLRLVIPPELPTELAASELFLRACARVSFPLSVMFINIWGRPRGLAGYSTPALMALRIFWLFSIMLTMGLWRVLFINDWWFRFPLR